MPFIPNNMKNTALSLILTIGLLCFCGLGNAQKVHGMVLHGAMGQLRPGTGSYTFNINGSSCTIWYANMAT